ncbi:MAG: DUF6263 family protein [Ignavibacteria bacterium]|nr:DUF6263 family protein [Ignavibacteria bacterium]
MKKLITFVVVISLFAFGCKKETETKEPVSETKSIDTTNIKPIKVQENISITYDLNKNTTLKFKLTTYQKSTQTLQLDSLVSGYVEQNVDYYVTASVKEKESNGNLTVDFNVDKVVANLKSSTGESLTYNSDNPPTDSVKKLQTKTFDVIAKANFSARISPTGDILDIFRTDSIIDKLISDAPRKPSTEERFQITNDVSQGLLRPLIQQIFRTVTDKKLNVDSVWTQSYPTQLSVFEIENTATYKVTKIFESNGNRLVEIEGTLKVNSKGKQDYSEGNVNYKFHKPKVSGISKSYFDLDKKCFRSSTADVTFEVVVDMQQKGNPKIFKRTETIRSKNSILLLN